MGDSLQFVFRRPGVVTGHNPHCGLEGFASCEVAQFLRWCERHNVALSARDAPFAPPAKAPRQRQPDRARHPLKPPCLITSPVFGRVYSELLVTLHSNALTSCRVFLRGSRTRFAMF
jgi:hypothetical protein